MNQIFYYDAYVNFLISSDNSMWVEFSFLFRLFYHASKIEHILFNFSFNAATDSATANDDAE